MISAHPGDKLDHYEIERVVARSGMASIFRAVDVRDGKVVAIKVPHPEMESDPIFYERFQREGKIGGELDHPGIMKVYNDPERSDVYMVMEWCEGKLLREILTTQGKLPPGRAVEIMLQLCNALEYMHTKGVVHRDLKPENIMVDTGDRVKIIDFGIAHTAGGRRLTFAKLSDTMGTPDYISPEQVSGKRGDARSDIYALGVMLYEMLTGKVPFTGANQLLIMNDRLLNNPPPPRHVNPEITPEMQEIIYRAMERDPRRRYASAREFAHDLTHPEEVGVAERDELTNWRERKSPWLRRYAFYALLALIPIVIFGLMLLVAKHAK